MQYLQTFKPESNIWDRKPPTSSSQILKSYQPYIKAFQPYNKAFEPSNQSQIWYLCESILFYVSESNSLEFEDPQNPQPKADFTVPGPLCRIPENQIRRLGAQSPNPFALYLISQKTFLDSAIPT